MLANYSGFKPFALSLVMRRWQKKAELIFSVAVFDGPEHTRGKKRNCQQQQIKDDRFFYFIFKFKALF